MDDYIKEHWHVAENTRSNKLKHVVKTKFEKPRDAAWYANSVSKYIQCESCGTIHRQPKYYVIVCRGIGRQEHYIDRWYVSKCKI